MVLNFYVVICVLSLACCVLFFWNRRSYYPVLYALVYLLALLSHVCYVLLAISKDVREALIINKGLYVGGCFFPLVGMLIPTVTRALTGFVLDRGNCFLLER